MSVQAQTPRVTREQALEIAKRAEEILKTRFGATRVIVFGSARGDAPWHEGSDLDLAVEGIKPSEFSRARAALERDLAPFLEIELVELKTVSPRMRARILGEFMMSEDSIPRLKNLVQDELASLNQIVADLEATLQRARRELTKDDKDLLAFRLQRFYSNIENIFERISVEFDGGVPRSERWHTDLLFRMTRPRAEKRPAVIDEALWSRLDDYMSFRHVVVHGYAIDFDPERLEAKAANAGETFAMLRAQLAQFFGALESHKENAESSSQGTPS